MNSISKNLDMTEKKKSHRTEEILSTEYSEEFDNIRKNMMVTSFYKYGPMEENYKKQKTLDSIKSLEIRLNEYIKTGNMEYLADIANFAMIEFIHPQHTKAHYKKTDGGCTVHGMGVNQIKEL